MKVNRHQLKKKRRLRNSLSKSEIVDAALQIVNQEGIEKLSMRHIADRLKCSVASPYAHFKNQEEIIKALIAIGENRLTNELKKAQASRTEPNEQLAEIARTYWSFARENKELHKLMFNMSHGQMYRKALPHLPTSYRVFLETVRFAYIRKDQSKEKGEYPAIARTMWAWMYGLIVLDLTGMLKIRRGTDPLEEGIAYFKMLLSFHRVI